MLVEARGDAGSRFGCMAAPSVAKGVSIVNQGRVFWSQTIPGLCLGRTPRSPGVTGRDIREPGTNRCAWPKSAAARSWRQYTSLAPALIQCVGRSTVTVSARNGAFDERGSPPSTRRFDLLCPISYRDPPLLGPPYLASPGGTKSACGNPLRATTRYEQTLFGSDSDCLADFSVRLRHQGFFR